MITRFITEVNTKFNPFSAKSRSARLFLSFLPPTARSQGMAIQAKLLPRASTDKAALQVKFSTGYLFHIFPASAHIPVLCLHVCMRMRMLAPFFFSFCYYRPLTTAS